MQEHSVGQRDASRVQQARANAQCQEPPSCVHLEFSLGYVLRAYCQQIFEFLLDLYSSSFSQILHHLLSSKGVDGTASWAILPGGYREQRRKIKGKAKFWCMKSGR